MKTGFFLFGIFLASVGFGVTDGPGTPCFAEAPSTYTVGVMTKSYDEKRAKALEKFEEIIGKYLEERAAIQVRFKALTYGDLARAIEKGSVDFVWGYGLVISMELNRRFPLFPIVSPTLGEDQRRAYRRLVVSTKEAAPSLADATGFKGKRLTYVGDEQWSFELLVFKVWVAERFGIKDLAQVFTLKGREPDEGFFIPASKRGAIYSLFIREADVAVAHEFEYLTQEKLTPHAIRERVEVLPFLNPSEGFLEAPVFVRKGTDSRSIDQLTQALLAMPRDPEGKQILLSSKISGFVKVSDQDYRSVKALMVKKEELGVK
jgi:ABC-type phosphate/phosphonate transport system substrate-binding protein